MAKAEFGTPKYIAKQMKAKGLQKLKWYCQVCEKQCRDDNGFKCHVRSENHLKRIQSISSKDIEGYSKQFQDYFVSNLRNYHGEKAINANKFYNQLIQQKDHVHLNSTKWSSLSSFIQHLSKEGLIRADITDETDTSLNGLDIAYINNSGDEIMRKTLLKKQNDLEKNEGQLSMKILENQIKRGQELQSSMKEDESEDDGKMVKSDKPIKIQLGGGLKKAQSKTPLKINAFKISKPNPLRENPLKSTKNS